MYTSLLLRNVFHMDNHLHFSLDFPLNMSQASSSKQRISPLHKPCQFGTPYVIVIVIVIVINN